MLGGAVLEIHPASADVTVVPAGKYSAFPEHSQLPAVSESDVMVVAVFVVNETAEPFGMLDCLHSPMLPALAHAPPMTPVITGVLSVVPAASDVMFAFAPDVATAELQPNPEPFVH